MHFGQVDIERRMKTTRRITEYIEVRIIQYIIYSKSNLKMLPSYMQNYTKLHSFPILDASN